MGEKSKEAGVSLSSPRRCNRTGSAAAGQRVTELLRDFARHKLPPFGFLRGFTVTLPWERMFECDIHLEK